MTKTNNHTDKIAEVFRREGFNGTTMSMISEATGLQKGSLYHHYPMGKADMAVAAMNAIGDHYIAVTKPAFSSDVPIRKQLEDWADSIAVFYRNGDANCILGTMTISGGKEVCSKLIKESFENWITSLTHILEGAGIKKTTARTQAIEAIERIQGALIVARALEDNSNFDRLIKQLPDILLKNKDKDFLL